MEELFTMAEYTYQKTHQGKFPGVYTLGKGD